METQSYHHTESPPSRAPTPLRWLFAGVIGSIVLLIALPVAMLIDRDGLVDSIMRNTPDLAPEHLGWVVALVMVYSIGLHLVDVALLLWLTPRVLRGRNWARLTLTAYLVVATYFSLDSAAKGMMFLWAVIPTDLLHVLMIALLWVPKSVRGYFAVHRAQAARAREQPTTQP